MRRRRLREVGAVDRGAASFGDAVRAGRVRAGLTQQELAARAGVSVRAVRYIEQGKVTRPRRESMRRLAEVVGLEAEGDWPEHRADERLRIGVLGRFELRGGGQPVDMGPLKQRCLLALLALQPNRVVHRDEIVDVLWGARPPESCQNLVHTYISRLRRAAEAGRVGSETALISSVRGGYRLTVDVEQLDLLRFDEDAARASQLRLTDQESAMAVFEQALRLWRGPVLEDLPDEVRRHPSALAVAGRRVAVALAHADTALALGRHDPVVEQLRALVHDEPLHEGLHARLMLGLAGSGQQAAALRLFGEIRDRLADDLGIEPGTEILAAHLRIIRSEVTAAAPRATRLELGHPTPAQLPADVGGFTGRDEHLERLDSVLQKRASEPGSAVTICAIAGTAGVGKTALAVHWAHRVRERFPDGQLYVNLRGYASDSPVRPLEALTRFLHALGLPSERVPVDEEEAVGLYRTMLADRRTLILLDNASGADQVRPLLPGSSGCLVLITSRDRLAGLAVAEGAHRITLDVLDPDSAQTLLARMIGPDRTDGEAKAVSELAEVVACLPLALRIVAANLVSLPYTSLADYAGELRRRGRLNELVVDGDEAGAVRAAFDLSYDTLEPAARRLFRLLGLVPGPDFTADAAAALSDGERRDCGRLLYQLSGAHLVHEHAAGRYQFHDLLKEYAADRAWSEDGSEQVRAATERLFDHYLGSVDAATRLLYPHVLRMPVAVVGTPPVSETAAIDWLDAELPNLVAAAKACLPGMVRYSWQLADSLRGYFLSRGYGTEGLTMCRVALTNAQQEWETRAEASINDIMGLIHYNLSDYARAASHHTKALALNRRIEHSVAEASSLHNLGRVHSQLGKPTQALLHYEQALTINRRIGNHHGEASDLNYVGAAWLSRGRPDRAIAHQTQALVISRQIGSRSLELAALNGLGLAYWALGQLDQAVRFHAECLEVCERMGHKVGATNAMVCLAETLCDAGRFQEAYAQAQNSITEGRKLGERRHEVGGLDVLATVHLHRGNPEIAARYYADALQIAREIGFGYGETSVLIGLSTALRRSGKLAEAISHGHDALAVLHDSGMRLLEGRALTELAHAYLGLGDLDQAGVHIARALKVVRDRRQRLAEARALDVLGLIRGAAGKTDEARTHARAALDIFIELGAPESGAVQA